MEALPFHSHQDISSPAFLMNAISANFRAKICFCSSSFRGFRFSSLGLNDSPELTNGGSRKKRVLKDSVRVRVKVSDAQLKENWLASLSSPFIGDIEQLSVEGQDPKSNAGPNWTIGIDPDVSGALALLKSDDLGCSAQVFDTPHLHALVGKSVRRRLDARAIVQLLQSFEAPLGTTAYIEQSIPYPQDGKQGWWGGGFGYGLWIGILVASGFSVVPVPSALWKHHFELSGNGLSKDDSRRVASTLFPSVDSLLKRKKDHGRAEALLIAAYGKGLGIKSDPSIT